MGFGDNLQYKIENASIYFQGGVRRSVLIFAGICLVILAPSYFLGQFSSNLWKNSWYNDKNIVIPKNVTEQEYAISETEVVSLANNTNDLYVSVNNKANKEIGFFPWVYTVQVLNNNGSILSQRKISSYLLPEETKYIVINSSDSQGTKLNLIREPETKSRLYNPNSNQLLKQPNVEIRTQELTPIPNSNNLKIRAIFKNNDQIVIQRFDVLYIIRDTRQSVVGIGTYSFNGFIANSEREMILEYPKPKNREARFLDLRWSVNYLDETNIKLQ
jgi:hypothetical protein